MITFVNFCQIADFELNHTNFAFLIDYYGKHSSDK